MFPASNLLFIKRIISRCLIRHFCSPYFSLLASRLLSVICTTPKLSNLSCENIKNYDLDEETVTTEAILGSVHYISKFIPNLAQVSHQLRPLLGKNAKFIWADIHENCSLEKKIAPQMHQENFLTTRNLKHDLNIMVHVPVSVLLLNT